MQPETLARIRLGDHKKGDVLGIARVAGIMASKKTSGSDSAVPSAGVNTCRY